MASDRRIFYLFLRALGLVMLIHAVSALVEQACFDLQEGILNEEFMAIWSTRMSGYVPAACSLAVGGYLFFSGRTILDRVAPQREGRCGGCAYELRGVTSGRCPECGASCSTSTGPVAAAAQEDPLWMRSAVVPSRMCVALGAGFIALYVLNRLLVHYELIYWDCTGRCCLAMF